MHLLKFLVYQNLNVLFYYGEVEMVSNYDIIFAILPPEKMHTNILYIYLVSFV